MRPCSPASATVAGLCEAGDEVQDTHPGSQTRLQKPVYSYFTSRTCGFVMISLKMFESSCS